jgi:class 3 adenylate cyclase
VELRTRTKTVVFTDMADYTKSVVKSDREELRALLQRHQAMVEPVLTARGGRVVKGIGDSFMALFDTATDAVRACLDLVEAHAPQSGAAVTFRASCATGDVEETSNDAFGETVNLSARINARIPAGEVWISAGTWHCMNQAEIPWESTGRHVLKGIPGEVEVFRAVARHQSVLPDPLIAAVRTSRLVVWNEGDPVPTAPANGHVVLVGFTPGSATLAQAVDALPVLDPSHIWLQAYQVGPAERIEWAQHGRGLVVATADAFTATVARYAAPLQRAMGSDTIILDSGGPPLFNLVIAGVCLPAVPFAEVVAGYSYDLLPDGRWVNRNERAMLRLEVSSGGVVLTALSPGITVDGQHAAIGSSWTLRGGSSVGSHLGTLRFHAFTSEGFLGALVGDSPMHRGVGAGERVELGREPNHPGLLLPDRNTQDNIRWCAGPRAARARDKGFTMDKSLTGRRQTAVEASAGGVSVVPLHETCPTLLLTADGTVSRLPGPRTAQLGDAILVGTTVVALREAGL